MDRTAAPFLAMLGPCIVYQNVAHHPRGDGEELRPVLPADVLPVDQPEVGLVHQSRGLQNMAAPLVRQVNGSHPMQLLLEDGPQTFHSRQIAPAPGDQQLRNVLRSLDYAPARRTNR